MRTKRERLQLIHDVLKVIQDGKRKPTHIMYKANLSHQMLNEYLEYLLSQGFIVGKNSKKSKIYELTEKGHKYLKEYATISSFVESFGLD